MSCSSCLCPQVSGPQPCQCGARPCCCSSCNHNPCSCACPGSTVTCETLPSQIDNFTKQFFGEVTKTEVDGTVTWVLPCNLDTGLENNPRFDSEGLACYFLRLFEQGIIGLTGPKGDTGTAGADGNNAYTVTLESFNQPSGADPSVQVRTAYNPAIFAGLTIFIQTSGYYFINATDGNGVLFLTLVDAADGAPAVITAGKLVTATGPQGTGTQGPDGPQGVPGQEGTPGESFTATNGQYYTNPGTNYTPGVTYDQVNFTASLAQVTLPSRGKYQLTAVVSLLGKATVAAGDIVEVKLRDLTILADVEASEQGQSNIEDIERTQVVLHAQYETDSDNHLIGLFAKCTTAGAIELVANRTVITFVRLE